MQLRVDHISKAFSVRGQAGALQVLDDVNLDIAAGEVVVLLGPSGCGKSTLLNIIAGFLPPSEGRVLHDGLTLTDTDRRFANGAPFRQLLGA